MKILVLISVVGVLVSVAAQAEELKHNYKPKEGYVPDAKTAIRIAVAVWEPIYGVKVIEGEKPYSANLTNGVWVVLGSLPKRTPGGVAVAEIAKDDGRIVRVTHTK